MTQDYKETVPLGEQPISSPFKVLAFYNMTPFDFRERTAIDVGGGVLGGIRASLGLINQDVSRITVIDPRIKKEMAGNIKGTAENLPIETGSQDLYYSQISVPTWIPPELLTATYDEMIRVLKPGARAVMFPPGNDMIPGWLEEQKLPPFQDTVSDGSIFPMNGLCRQTFYVLTNYLGWNNSRLIPIEKIREIGNPFLPSIFMEVRRTPVRPATAMDVLTQILSLQKSHQNLRFSEVLPKLIGQKIEQIGLEKIGETHYFVIRFGKNGYLMIPSTKNTRAISLELARNGSTLKDGTLEVEGANLEQLDERLNRFQNLADTVEDLTITDNSLTVKGRTGSSLSLKDYQTNGIIYCKKDTNEFIEVKPEEINE